MGQQQPSLFDEVREAKPQTVVERIDVCDPNVDPLDKPRLRGQCLLIYNRLRQGPATNVELLKIAPKYTSRISDLRLKAGLKIVNHKEPGRGTTVYELVEEQRNDSGSG